MKKIILTVSTILILVSCGSDVDSIEQESSITTSEQSVNKNTSETTEEVESKINAATIDVLTLETACDCGDAVLSLAKGLEIISNEIGESEPTDKQKEDKKALSKKMRKVEKHCRKDKGFTRDIMEECESFVEGQEIMKNL